MHAYPLAHHWNWMQIAPACKDSVCICLPAASLWPQEWAWLQSTSSQTWSARKLMSREWPSAVRDRNWWINTSAFLSLYVSVLRHLPPHVSEGPWWDWATVASSNNLLINTLCWLAFFPCLTCHSLRISPGITSIQNKLFAPKSEYQSLRWRWNNQVEFPEGKMDFRAEGINLGVINLGCGCRWLSKSM